MIPCLQGYQTMIITSGVLACGAIRNMMTHFHPAIRRLCFTIAAWCNHTARLSSLAPSMFATCHPVMYAMFLTLCDALIHASFASYIASDVRRQHIARYIARYTLVAYTFGPDLPGCVAATKLIVLRTV